MKSGPTTEGQQFWHRTTWRPDTNQVVAAGATDVRGPQAVRLLFLPAAESAEASELAAVVLDGSDDVTFIDSSGSHPQGTWRTGEPLRTAADQRDVYLLRLDPTRGPEAVRVLTSPRP